MVRIEFGEAQSAEFKVRLTATAEKLQEPLKLYLDTFMGVPLKQDIWEKVRPLFNHYHNCYGSLWEVDSLDDNEGNPKFFIVRDKDKSLEFYYPQIKELS